MPRISGTQNFLLSVGMSNTRQEFFSGAVNITHHFANCRIVYISPRTRSYALNHEVALNPEPYAYESGFSVKWLIEEQLAGGLNYDPAAGAVVAPWLSSGPYLWVDGLNPRSDGLTWLCSDLRSDSTHATLAALSLFALILRRKR